jgi:hypothetical protein
MPDQRQKDDDRDRHAEQPKQNSATHDCFLQLVMASLRRPREFVSQLCFCVCGPLRFPAQALACAICSQFEQQQGPCGDSILVADRKASAILIEDVGIDEQVLSFPSVHSVVASWPRCRMLVARTGRRAACQTAASSPPPILILHFGAIGVDPGDVPQSAPKFSRAHSKSW